MADTPIALHRLTFITERDGVTVGRPDTETYVVLPRDGAELLHHLVTGRTPEQAAEWYRATFGESIDIADFLDTLRQLGFVRGPGESPVPPRTVRFHTLGRALFSPVAWLVYALVVITAILAMITRPDLRPDPGHVFFLPSLIAVQFILVLTQIPGLLVHEWFHVMAGRRRNLPTRLTVSRRMFFAVFETELNGLLSIPRSQRYLAFLAGMLADVLVIAGLTLAAAADPGFWLAQLALAIAYLTLVRLAWQLLIFLRTDLYYVLTTALGCTNLTEASTAYLRARFRWLRRLPARPADPDEWSQRDLRYAPAFAVLTMIGSVGLVVALGFGGVPVLIEFVVRLRTGLAHGVTGGGYFWDSAASLGVLFVQFAVFPLLAGRFARTKNRRRAVAAQGAS